jgi:hypothetical protein
MRRIYPKGKFLSTTRIRIRRMMTTQSSAITQIGTYIEYKSMTGSNGNGFDATTRLAQRLTAERACVDRSGMVREQAQLWKVERALVGLLTHVLDCHPEALKAVPIAPWASVTFSGARHVLTYALATGEEQDRAQAFCGIAQEAEWPLDGAFVADMSATVVDGHLIIEALTVLDQ